METEEAFDMAMIQLYRAHAPEQQAQLLAQYIPLSSFDPEFCIATEGDSLGQ
jgi:hypothetical protein